MKILITGSSGFLGSHLADHLAGEGHQVRVLLRAKSSRTFLKKAILEEVIGDVRQFDSLGPAVEGVDAIVHAAGLNRALSESDFDAVHDLGTANLLRAAESASNLQRFVYVSSLAAHGPSQNGKPRAVNARSRPVSAYGRSKLRGEKRTLAYGDHWPVSIVRPTIIYGPRDRQTLTFFDMARWRIAPLLGDGTNLLTFVYVEDAASAIAKAVTIASNTSRNIYFLDDGRFYSWQDLVQAISAATGHKIYSLNLPPLLFSAAALVSEGFGAAIRRPMTLTRDKVAEMRQRYWLCSSEITKKDLGWKPTIELEEGLQLAAAWYRKHGWI